MKKLSKSLEDYLEAILILEINKKDIHSVDIAKMLKVSKPAVSKALNELKAKHYIKKDKYTEIAFTENGRNEAKKIYHRHLTIKNFLLKIGVKEKTAETDCCLIEHVISEETLKALEKLTKK